MRSFLPPPIHPVHRERGVTGAYAPLMGGRGPFIGDLWLKKNNLLQKLTVTQLTPVNSNPW